MPARDDVYAATRAVTSTVAAASGGGIDTTLLLTILGTIAGAISAVGVIAGGIYWFRTRRARRAKGQREEQQTADIAEMGDAIVDLKSMVTSLAEEMRGRAPRPRLRFVTSEGPTPAVVARIPAIPAVDVEAIVHNELLAVRSTRPPIEQLTPKPPESTETAVDAPADMKATLQALAKIAETHRGVAGLGLGFGGAKYLPVTEDDYTAFEKGLETYAGEVRTFVHEWLEYLAKRRVTIPFEAQIDNDGGAPAEEARIKIHFPAPCDEAEWPERPGLPARPKFQRRLNPMHPGNRYAAFDRVVLPSMLRTPNVGPIDFHRDHSGPHYRKGSVEVSYDYDSLPHHDTVRLDVFIVGIPRPGVYAVRWTIGAKNLVHLEEGTLEVEVVHEEPDGSPVTTLGELVKARHSAA